MTNEEIEKFMGEAILQAEKAYQKGEIPIGAVIVKGGRIIAKAYNTREKLKNAVCHAEILAINKACKKLKNWRLIDCEMFVTVEPCLMCLGALYNARVKRLYYGTMNKSNGRIDVDYNTTIQNHKLEVVAGIRKEECARLLSTFFKN